MIEYGNAIKDLACANIFPGDLLSKNFGVSRHGRVIFYDYDELALVTEMNFRALPSAGTHEEEMSAEPFFSVDEQDVFPEQWLPFLVPPGRLRAVFLDAHADLLTPAFWRGMQRQPAARRAARLLPLPRSPPPAPRGGCGWRGTGARPAGPNAREDPDDMGRRSSGGSRGGRQGAGRSGWVRHGAADQEGPSRAADQEGSVTGRQSE